MALALLDGRPLSATVEKQIPSYPTGTCLRRTLHHSARDICGVRRPGDWQSAEVSDSKILAVRAFRASVRGCRKECRLLCGAM